MKQKIVGLFFCRKRCSGFFINRLHTIRRERPACRFVVINWKNLAYEGNKAIGYGFRQFNNFYIGTRQAANRLAFIVRTGVNSYSVSGIPGFVMGRSNRK